jgi:hypothetical protein
VEPAVQIRLVRENLALAIALWGAAQKGVITAGFVPNRSEFLTADGRVVKVSTPLEVHDSQELVRCVNNQVRGSFAFSAIQTNLVLESVYGNSPIQADDSDLRAARCVLYLLSKSVSQDLMAPVWVCYPDYRRKFQVQFASFTLDASGLDGKKVCWDDFGGLNKYLDLLEFCSVEVEGCKPHTKDLLPAEEGPVPLSSGPGAASPVEDLSDESVAKFVRAWCTRATNEMIIAKDLYDAYVDWCCQQDQDPLAQRSFGMRLTAMGFQRRRRGRGRHWWLGIGVREPVSS